MATHLYGEVLIGETSVYIEASAYELRDWSTKPGSSWPCSVLGSDECDGISATFDTNGLIEISHPGLCDLPADEFNAWSSDVLRDILPKDHPAYFVTVGQFEEN
jgi:hypothetical protein